VFPKRAFLREQVGVDAAGAVADEVKASDAPELDVDARQESQKKFLSAQEPAGREGAEGNDRNGLTDLDLERSAKRRGHTVGEVIKPAEVTES